MRIKKNIVSNTKMNLQVLCDFCSSEDIDVVYKVPDSRLGVRIAVCNYCGLVQSISTKTKNNERLVSTSSGADWGNIRHGKGLRLNAASKLLDSFLLWDEIKNVLDVGSNRGDFVKWLQTKNSVADIVAVEPDGNIIDDYKSLPNLTLYIDKLEKINLSSSYFDFVYCAQTLEHADSASTMLEQIQVCMKTGTYLFLEVPNIDILKADDNVEEFFMDKHTFHFSHSLLRDYLNFMGYEIVHDGTDIFNLSLLLRKLSDRNKYTRFRKNNNLVKYTKEMIKHYSCNFQSNRNQLKNVVDRLHQFMERQKVVFWGAGRLFDALIKYGGLKTDKIHGLIDEYLWKILPNVHGVEIKRPEYLKIAAPDVVIILARSSADEIAQKVQKLGVRHIIKFRDLFLAT